MATAAPLLSRRGGAVARVDRAPAYQPEPRAPLRVVESTPRRRRQRILRAAGLLVLLSSLLAVVFGHAMLAQEQIRLTNAQAQLSAEQAVHHQVLAAVAGAETPSRIVAAAEALHMVAPSTVQQLPWVPLTPTAPATTGAGPTGGAGSASSPTSASGSASAAATR
jgi:hypothetical protein